MDHRARNITVGLTTLLGILGLMLLLLLFGYVPKLLQEGYMVKVRLEDAASLNSGSRVELAGIDIGSVQSIDFAKPYGSGVEATLRIRDDIDIPETAQAVIDAPLLGGSPKIKFVLKKDEPMAGNFLPTDGSAVVEGKQGAIAGAFGEFERISNSIETLAERWDKVGIHVTKLLEPQDIAAVEAGEVDGNLTTAVARVDRRLEEMKQVLAAAGEMIEDPALRENIHGTAENLNQASAEAAEMVAALRVRYVSLADDAAGTLKQLNALAEAANSDDGSLGKLMRDPALYDNLDSAAERIGSAVDELKLLIQKWKAEGVPINL